MILADKIIKERKRLGLSQEELAEKMNVSRQAVSKWEGNQSIPEIEKILQLSSLFGVSTDYLLKNEKETDGYPPKSGFNRGEGEKTENENSFTPALGKGDNGYYENTSSIADTSSSKGIRRVTADYAEKYLSWRKRAAKNIAVGIFLCILSFSFMLLFPMSIYRADISNEQNYPLVTSNDMQYEENQGNVIMASEGTNVIAVIGASLILFCPIILAVTAAAVVMFAYTGSKNAPYKFIDAGSFETEIGVAEIVKERQRAFSGTYAKLNFLGAIIAVISLIPVFARVLADVRLNIVLTIVIAGIGTVLFVYAGVRRASMQKLLKEGRYNKAV